MHGINTFNQEIKIYDLYLFGVVVTEQAGKDDQLLQLKRISALTAFKCPAILPMQVVVNAQNFKHEYLAASDI